MNNTVLNFTELSATIAAAHRDGFLDNRITANSVWAVIERKKRAALVDLVCELQPRKIPDRFRQTVRT